MKKEKESKIIFYFENAPITWKEFDKNFTKKVMEYLEKLKPKKMWERRGIFNKRIKSNVFPSFIIIYNNKLIACQIVTQNIEEKYELYNGIKLFDEVWFFTTIPIEKTHLHYKVENNLPIKQKIFGLDQKNEITLIKEIH